MKFLGRVYYLLAFVLFVCRKRVGKRMLHLGIVILTSMSFTVGCAAWPEKETYSTTNIEEYRNFEGHISEEKEGIFSGLKIFPLELTEEIHSVSYIYECENVAFNNGYFIYLEGVWSEAAFEQEIQRLQSIFLSYGEESKRIIYDAKTFAYPAYITVFDDAEGCMEYALVDKENKRIVYLYCQFQEHLLESKVDKQYILTGQEEVENESLQQGYNMYKFEVKDGVFEYLK